MPSIEFYEIKKRSRVRSEKKRELPEVFERVGQIIVGLIALGLIAANFIGK